MWLQLQLSISPTDPHCAFLGHWPASVMLIWSSYEALRDLKQWNTSKHLLNTLEKGRTKLEVRIGLK